MISILRKPTLLKVYIMLVFLIVIIINSLQMFNIIPNNDFSFSGYALASIILLGIANIILKLINRLKSDQPLSLD